MCLPAMLPQWHCTGWSCPTAQSPTQPSRRAAPARSWKPLPAQAYCETSAGIWGETRRSSGGVCAARGAPRVLRAPTAPAPCSQSLLLQGADMQDWQEGWGLRANLHLRLALYCHFQSVKAKVGALPFSSPFPGQEQRSLWARGHYIQAGWVG